MPDRLFTPRFLIMFGFSFTVFLSVFQLLPTAPYRILDMGGTTATAGLFHGMLTFSSAFSAPLTGPITDRIGHRPVLIWVSLALAGFTLSYAWIDRIEIMLIVVVVHGSVWSALLSASSAYMTATVPANRRAEGLAYWGLSSVLAIGAAPAVGFWVYRHGWTALCVEMMVLNLLMAAIAWRLPDDRAIDAAGHPDPDRLTMIARLRQLDPFSQPIEWRVLGLSIGMGLISFGYGSITSFSALFADSLGVSPRSLFLSAMAVAILVGRLTVGRTLDRRGHRHVLLRCMLAPPLGLAVLAFAQGSVTMLVAAVIFGAGFGLMHPAYAAYVMNHVPANRRGAAFGAMLAAFDTGIGTGASLMGWLIHAHGFRVAFAVAAALAALSMPYFILAERRLGFRTET